MVLTLALTFVAFCQLRTTRKGMYKALVKSPYNPDQAFPAVEQSHVLVLDVLRWVEPNTCLSSLTGSHSWCVRTDENNVSVHSNWPPQPSCDLVFGAS